MGPAHQGGRDFCGLMIVSCYGLLQRAIPRAE
jgi:hypothetical protein